MDIHQLQSAIEQALQFIISQSPDAIDRLIKILQMIQNSAYAIWGICQIIQKYPILVEATNKLLFLLQSGVSIHEIAAILAAWAAPLGEVATALIQLLSWIGGVLLLF